MDEVRLEGETAETRTLESVDRSSDGVLGFSRAQSAEQDLVRDGILDNVDAQASIAWYRLCWLWLVSHLFFWRKRYETLRERLLRLAALAPPILRGWSITPLDDRMLVEYASFKEGYVCEACAGSGVTDSPCDICQGEKRVSIKRDHYEPCGACRVVGSDRHEPFISGLKPCPSCLGSGLAPGVMAIPDASKQDHSYGDILSVGAGVPDLRPGDRVVFSKMAGIYLKGDSRNCCLLRRGEVMGLMRKAK